MKNWLKWFLIAITTIVAGCCMHQNIRTPEPRESYVVDALLSNTIAMVIRDGDGDIAAYCTGVWVAKDLILTADHCIRSPIEEIVGLEAQVGDSQETLDKRVEAMKDGFLISFITKDDSNGVFHEPSAMHVGAVVKHDRKHDLALLKVTKNLPRHGVAKLARVTPRIGSDVHIMGHVTGLTWTYTRGIVAAYREANFRPTKISGPFLQVAGEAWKGNSGGGAFNDAGELIGIASFLAPAPNEVFFVHVETIRCFLEGC